MDGWDKVPSFDAGEAPHRSTSSLGPPIVPSRVAAAQIWATVVVLGGYGAWGLINCLHAHAWVPAIGSAASIAAAIGVALRKSWSRPLVFLLALLFVGTWVYYTWLASTGGFYRGWPLRNVVISLVPGFFFSGIAAFCCYVVAVRLRPSQGQT
jgi:hypothetical protein